MRSIKIEIKLHMGMKMGRKEFKIKRLETWRPIVQVILTMMRKAREWEERLIRLK
jgi:hypothetical protein